ncbi:ATP-binding protein [Pedobacter sp. Hv1]|uniref:ATP-binding protein n=1 Tax=Pedobacter sp. Hv1 TaxID=1740090 RepID=UPI0006D8A728|nr:ATP-binding protein [Pedobacter sp. Hv1]KQC00395.1 hypothetical protein AQF98_12995 [Pedobacter sp. Hv1]
MIRIKYIDQNIAKILVNDPDPLNMVRARFLAQGLSSSLIVLLLTLPSFYIHAQHLLFFRSVLIIVAQVGLIWVLLKTPKWKLVAHLTCIIIAVLIWSNLFIFLQGIKIISLQFMLLLVVLSYYLLGIKWGVFYSLLSILFMGINFALYGQAAMLTIHNQIEVDNYSFLIVFIFNFLLIIYIQHHFFYAFNETIKQLKIKQEEEKKLNEKLQETITISEQLSKAKTNFLSTISHELRTPLNGVIGMSDLLLLDNPRKEQEENLNILKFSANNLLNLINDVLDINKIESGKVDIEKIPFSIHELINSIFAGFKNRATAKGLVFTLDCSNELNELGVIGDPTRLTQILNNLIENALKFTKDGKVNLTIKVIEKNSKNIRLYFCVSDTGIGIPVEKQELVFESFSQASTSTTRNYGGSGLGLAIVKNLLELHQSNISIQSEVNVGTSFSFEINYTLFDLNQNIPIEPNNKSIENMDISGLKILIAEDNQMNTLLMRKLLAKWNITPDFASNGADAVEAFKTNDYDLILMDIHMPIMDGYEASRTIRNYGDTVKSAVHIIALTASVALDVRNKITEAGINDYVSKPFNPEELRGKIEEIASHKSV